MGSRKWGEPRRETNKILRKMLKGDPRLTASQQALRKPIQTGVEVDQKGCVRDKKNK